MAKDGKNRIFSFFAAENRRFLSYVRRKLDDISQMDAEDIVEEVMLALIGKSEDEQEVTNLAAYIYRSLNNRIVDYQRAKARTVSLQRFTDEEEENSLLDLVADDSVNVLGEVEKKELLHRLAEAISRLEPRQRAVLIATEMEGKTFRELSEMWNEPIGTLLSRKSRAVKALKEMLADFQ